MNRKPDHPFIDTAVAETIEYVVTREHNHTTLSDVQQGARRVAGHYGLRTGERRWLVSKVSRELGV